MSERELFWEWAKKENPKLIDEAETGCQFAKDILDYMFMGWVGSANREGYKLVPVNYECVWCGCTELGGWAEEAMIGACDD